MAKLRNRKNGIKSLAFDIYLNIDISGERFSIRSVTPETKIKDLKIQVELVAGIPYKIQRLHYLDKSDMMDESDLRHNDVVPGATIDLKLWKMWESVVKVVLMGNIQEILSLGLTMDKEWEKLDCAFYKHKVETAREKLHVALLLAAHRNNTELLKALLDLGADIDYKTSMGRTALHMAASQGNSECIDMILQRGASIEITDVVGRSAVDTAHIWGMKDSERHLFLYQWQTRASKADRKKSIPLMMHQKFDSSLPTWLCGNYGQIYHANILPPGKFSGSVISAPRRKPVKVRAVEKQHHESSEVKSNRQNTVQHIQSNDASTEEENELDGSQEGHKTVPEHKLGDELTKPAETQALFNMSGNDGSRYCKGGYYINSLNKARRTAHSRRSVPSDSSPRVSPKSRR